MPLIRLNYSEYENEPKQWIISEATFSQVNLIVGKNATGKSRLLTLIHGLSNILTGNLARLFESGNYDFEVELDGKIFQYKIKVNDSKVTSEYLSIDGEEMLSRHEDGSGTIYYQSKNEFIEFKLPTDAVAAVNRRDEIQHPFLIELHKWASSIAFYLFGSDFGKNRIVRMEDAAIYFDSNKSLPLDDTNNLVGIYTAAYHKYGKKLDKAIIADMKKLGYLLSDVGSTDINRLIKLPFAAIGMFTTEKDLGFENPQMHMSQGMFRALALVVHLNVCALSKAKNLILVDDIGEGLDYERATAIIDLLINKSINNGMQLIMTSNDRFVMNKVPLEYWSVLKRGGGVVKMFNIRNSTNRFNEFKYLGLNNFDFFTTDFIGQEKKNG